jgi:multidrug efflux system outer membrane protein
MQLALLALLCAQALSLKDLQERARRNDPRAQQAVAQLENATAKRDEAHAMNFPQIDYTAYVGGPSPQHLLRDPADINSVRDGWTPLGAVFHGDIQAVLPLYTFGKLSAGKSATDHLVLATSALLQRARDQAVFDVTKAYWGYQTARNADVSVVNIRKRLQDAQDQAKKLLAEQSDQISKSDALKLDYLAQEIEAQHASAAKGAALALTGIRLVAGLTGPFEIAPQDLPLAPETPPMDALLQRALQNRPEAKAAAEAVKARAALVDLERGKLYPDIGLVAGYRFTDTTNASNPSSPFLSNPYFENSPYLAIGLHGTLDIPQKLARVRQAEADLHEALATQYGAETLVRLELQQAVGDLDEARVKVDRYTKETAIGKQLAVQAGVAFESGLGEARELLEDTLLYARADGARLSALFDAQLAWAALEKATGGL